MDYIQIRNCARQMYDYALKSDYKIVYPTKTYYELGAESPTTAAMILKDEVKKQTVDIAHKAIEYDHMENRKSVVEILTLLRQAGINQTKADNHPLVQPAKQAFITNMERLYPRSICKRLAIIKKDAVVTDQIVPKFTGIKKFFLAKLAKKYARISR